MNPKIVRLIPLVILLLLAAVLATGLFREDPTKNDGRMIGQQIGMFSIPTLGAKGKYFTPHQWDGRVALISVFASWCGPCQMEHDVLMSVAKTGKVAVYGIAWKDHERKLIAWLTAHGNPYQSIGFDEAGSASVPLGLTGVPETYLVDSTGTIRFHYSAPLTEDIVANTLLPLIDALNQQHAPAQ
jgi:cytochrome c biogenesis protein CcmG/thiol:disulfide interchange protein DsbE